MEEELRETINEEACAKCGGKCCIIYSPQNLQHLGIIDLLLDCWMMQFKDVDVQPLHDPILSRLETEEGEKYRVSLPSWVDINKCPYCHPKTGCLVSREQRPILCREYMCDEHAKG